MALPLIISAKVYEADSYVVSPSEEVKPTTWPDNDLWPLVVSWSLEDNLGEPPRLELVLLPGSPWHIERTLQVRHRIVIEYDSGLVVQFRIRSLGIGTGEASSFRITADHIWKDLGDSVFRFLRAPGGTVTHSLPLGPDTVSGVLSTIFDSDYGMSPAFVLGTVETNVADLVVNLYANGSYHLDLLLALAEALRIKYQETLEFETVWSGGVLTFNFYRQAGWSGAERTAGVPDPARRQIDAPSGGSLPGQGNRVFLRYEDAQDDYFTRLIPFGGSSEAQRIGIGSAPWLVTAAVFNGTLTNITLQGSPIPITSAYAVPSSSHSIRSLNIDPPLQFDISTTSEPNTLIVFGDASTLLDEEVAFYSNTGTAKNGGLGGEVTYVENPVAEATLGRVERVIDFPEIPPYNNLFERAGGSADMSTWSAGLPLGIEVIGTPVVVQRTDDRAVYGDSYASVTCDKDEGVQTLEIVLRPTNLNPYFSAWTAVRVITGRVRLTIEDADGTVFPTGQYQAEGLSGLTMELAVGGAEGGEGIEAVGGPARVRLIALEDGTEFELDALTLTRSVGWWPYAQSMGPTALWEAAARYLIERGGIQSPSFETRLIDVSHFEVVGQDEVAVGSHGQIRDLLDTSGNFYNLVPVGRFVRVRSGRQGIHGPPYKEAVLARARPDLGNRLASGGTLSPVQPGERASPPSDPDVPRTPGLSTTTPGGGGAPVVADETCEECFILYDSGTYTFELSDVSTETAAPGADGYHEFTRTVRCLEGVDFSVSVAFKLTGSPATPSGAFLYSVCPLACVLEGEDSIAERPIDFSIIADEIAAGTYTVEISVGTAGTQVLSFDLTI